jgi:rubrerythrin
MCTVGGPMDVEYTERVKGKDYRCKSCGERFKAVGKRPVCPSCQSDDVMEE